MGLSVGDQTLQNRVDLLQNKIVTLYGGPQVLKTDAVVNRVAVVETMRLRGLIGAYEAVILDYYK